MSLPDNIFLLLEFLFDLGVAANQLMYVSPPMIVLFTIMVVSFRENFQVKDLPASCEYNSPFSVTFLIYHFPLDLSNRLNA
jgi:hypothetical protein